MKALMPLELADTRQNRFLDLASKTGKVHQPIFDTRILQLTQGADPEPVVDHFEFFRT